MTEKRSRADPTGSLPHHRTASAWSSWTYAALQDGKKKVSSGKPGGDYEHNQNGRVVCVPEFGHQIPSYKRAG
ncbi:MAG: hypothetical protein WKF84_06525 [Pyrinomonadaceae bacterium]